MKNNELTYYEQALTLLSEKGIETDYLFPASPELVNKAEERLGVKFPDSYRKMLSDFGILGFEGTDIYGLGKTGLEGTTVLNVVFATERHREQGLISQSMIRIMSSGYGPFFVIDCGIRDDLVGAVFEVSEAGVEDYVSKVADSFGEFVLNEVKGVLS